MSTPAPAPITPQASKGTLIRRLSSLEVQPKSELRGVRLRQLLWPLGAAGRRFRRIIDPADDSAAIAVPTIDCFTRPGSVQLVHEDEAIVLADHARIRALEGAGLFEFAG